ncbi:MAG: NAD(P)/FAD-dependent oxidoreductase [Proteobacteria bacterium]|nr:NAD(P)/FAD-dependent oxidoreductase [Pseudomonadota bacterium]
MDVGIAGAGPAGAFCAERLARRGHAVTLFDPSHPREKACGGGVTPGVFARYPELAALRSLGHPVKRARLRAGSSGVDVELLEPIDIFSRQRFDGALLERALAAGAVLEPRRVRRARAEESGAGLLVDGEWRGFDLVVGADGAASAVRRCLLSEKPGGPGGYATVGFHVSGLPEDELFVEFLPDMRGYLWSFPRPGHSSVGIAAPVGALGGDALGDRVLELLGRVYPGSLELGRVRYAASIPSPSHRQARYPVVAGPRFPLAGDAANQVDVITGEGIHHALGGAALLADAVDEAGPVAGPALYGERWQRGPAPCSGSSPSVRAAAAAGGSWAT